MFVPRKQSSKRRTRTQSDLGETDDNVQNQTAIQTLKAPSTTAALSRVGTSKALRSRLRPPPTVPGYEKPESVGPNKATTSRYSSQELEDLRLGTASVASLPIVTVAADGKQKNNTENAGASRATLENLITKGTDQATLPSRDAVAVDDDPPPPTPAQENEVGTDQKSRIIYRSTNTAEPFTKQWDCFGDKDESFTDREDDDEDNVPIVVINDKDVKIGDGTDSGSDSEQAREDSLWQRELLQRAGISATTASRLAESERDRQDEVIIREMDVVGFAGSDESALHTLVVDMEARCETALKDADGNRDKLERIQKAIEVCENKVDEAEQIEKKEMERAKYYRELQGDMELLCRELRKHRKRMLLLREARIEDLRKRGEAVEEYLKDGMDEYGRVRRAGTGARWIEHVDNESTMVDKEVEEIVKDMPVGLRNVYDVIERVTEWKEVFGQDYEQILGDAGTGRLIGALATCERNIDWVVDVNEGQRHAALTCYGGTEEIEMFVGAEWRPSDTDSCERVGKIVGCVMKVIDDRERKTLVDVMTERLDLELSACDTSGDCLWRSDVEKGVSVLSRWVEIGEIDILMDQGGVSE